MVFPSSEVFKRRSDKYLSHMISVYFLLPLVGADLIKSFPFLHIHHLFLHPKEKCSSVLSYLSFRSTVSPTQTSEAYEFYYIALVRLLVCLRQIISGKQKAASFTAADNPQKWTNDDWKYRREEKQVRKILWRIQRKKQAENRVTAKKKYFSLKKTISLSQEKVS